MTDRKARASRRRRRSALHRRLTRKGDRTCPRIGKMPITAAAKAWTSPLAADADHRQGPAGHAGARSYGAGHGHRARTATRWSSRPANDRASRRRCSGTMRALVANMVNGVTQGLREEADAGRRRLPRRRPQGDKLNLSLGFSHPVVHRTCPRASRSRRPTQTEIVIKGTDRQAVGQVAAEVRALSARPSPTRARASATRTSGRRSRKPRRSKERRP